MTISQTDLRKVIGIGVACWLVGAICAGAVGYLYVQSSQRSVGAVYNPLVCVTRKYIIQSKARSLFVSKHDPSATRRATASQAVASADDFLVHLITLPPGRNCARVLNP